MSEKDIQDHDWGDAFSSDRTKQCKAKSPKNSSLKRSKSHKGRTDRRLKGKGGIRKVTENALRAAENEERKRHNYATEGVDKANTLINLVDKVGRPLTSLAAANHDWWYLANEQLAKDVANLSFNNPLGDPVKGPTGMKFYPGVGVFTIMPTIGQADAINLAAQKIYSHVRYNNSGSKNYQPNDIISYILAVIEGHSLLSNLKRVYSLALTYKSHNYYYVKSMLHALGVDASDIKQHLADFRAKINTLALSLNSFAIPKSLTLRDRRVWMNGNIFKDQDIKKSQEFMFTQEYFYMYDDEHSRLRPQKLFTVGDLTNLTTFVQISNFIDQFIDNLLNSSSIGVMSGDIIKAYGRENLVLESGITDDYHVESVFNESVLSQIRNIDVVGKPEFLRVDGDSQNLPIDQAYELMYSIHCPSDGHITQGFIKPGNSGDRNYYIYAPDWTYNVQSSQIESDFAHNKILDFYKDDPGVGDVFIATRLSALSADRGTAGADVVYKGINYDNTPINIKYVPGIANPSAMVPLVTGTEVVIEFTVLTFNSTTKSESITKMNMEFYHDSSDFLGKVTTFNKFYNQPTYYLLELDGTTGKMTTQHEANSVSNYTSVDTTVIKNIHYAAILSEYGIN